MPFRLCRAVFISAVAGALGCGGASSNNAPSTARRQPPPTVVVAEEPGDAEEPGEAKDDDGWPAPAAPKVDQSSPRSALRSFLAAYEARRWELIFELIPHRERAGLTPEKLRQAWEGPQRDSIDNKVWALREVAEKGAISTTGSRATLHYGTGETLVFVLDGGVWYIEDF
jgi:hypothetical protein